MSKESLRLIVYITLPLNATSKLAMLKELYNTKLRGRRVLTRKDIKNLLEEI